MNAPRSTFEPHHRQVRPGSAVRVAILIAALGLSGCSSSGSVASTADVAGQQLTVLADRTEAEFTARGDGHFHDTGVLSYCRQNTGFDTGVFKALGFAPTGDALTLYEYCYNVSSDRLKVALGATNSRDGAVSCLGLDATSGKIVRGTIRRTGPCVP